MATEQSHNLGAVPVGGRDGHTTESAAREIENIFAESGQFDEVPEERHSGDPLSDRRALPDIDRSPQTDRRNIRPQTTQSLGNEIESLMDGEDRVRPSAESGIDEQGRFRAKLKPSEAAEPRQQREAAPELSRWSQQHARALNFEATSAQAAQVMGTFRQSIVGEMQSPSMQSLREANPSEWAAKQMELQNNLTAVDNVLREAGQQYEATRQNEMRERMVETGQALRKVVPGWGRETVTNAASVMSSYGFAPDEMQGIADPRVWAAAHELHELRAFKAAHGGGKVPTPKKSAAVTGLRDKLRNKPTADRQRTDALKARTKQIADYERAHGRRAVNMPTTTRAAADTIEHMLSSGDFQNAAAEVSRML